MQGRLFVGLFLCALFFVAGGDAQNQATTDKPVWRLEFLRVRPEKFGPAMGYLDDHWMSVQAEAKRQGAVLDYHRIQNANMATFGYEAGDARFIVLLTEYKNMDAYRASQCVLCDSTSERTKRPTAGDLIKPWTQQDLFETVSTQLFVEEPDTSSALKLLAKQ